MNEDGAQMFDEDKKSSKGEFDFDVAFEPAADLQLRTSCCCCIIAFDDCEDFMTIKATRELCCCSLSSLCQVCQCTDESNETSACCQGSSQNKCCSMIPLAAEKQLIDKDTKEVVDYYGCCSQACKNAACCCSMTKARCACCDPIELPSNCIKEMAQVFCLHLRCAFPCDDPEAKNEADEPIPAHVPCEIYCCGVAIYDPAAQNE